MADPRLASSALTNLSRVVVTLVSVWLIGGTFAALTHPAAKRKQLLYERQMQLKQARMEAAKRDLRVDRHLDAAYLAYDHLQFARAEREFRSAVKLRRDARTVRDLARFLSICCDPSIRDADEAVDLAHEAVRLEFDPGWRAKLTLADAYAIAVALSDTERTESYRRAIVRGLRSLMQLQFVDSVDLFDVSRREAVEGGLRTTVYDNEIRVDNVQHAWMAVRRILDVMPDYEVDLAGAQRLYTEFVQGYASLPIRFEPF